MERNTNLFYRDGLKGCVNSLWSLVQIHATPCRPHSVECFSLWLPSQSLASVTGRDAIDLIDYTHAWCIHPLMHCTHLACASSFYHHGVTDWLSSCVSLRKEIALSHLLLFHFHHTDWPIMSEKSVSSILYALFQRVAGPFPGCGFSCLAASKKIG